MICVIINLNKKFIFDSDFIGAFIDYVIQYKFVQ